MSIWRNMLRAAVTMIIFSVLFTALMTAVFVLTQTLVAANEKNAKLALLTQVLPAGSYDNDILQTTLALTAAESTQLGNAQASQVYLARQAGCTRAIIIETTAPDGYGGKIKLLSGINRDGVVQAVRVLAHQETPGLGDYIDRAKSDWITVFTGKSLGNPIAERWRVKKDGGAFDYVSGATVTPRAVVKAVHRALAFVMAEPQRFFGPPCAAEKDVR